MSSSTYFDTMLQLAIKKIYFLDLIKPKWILRRIVYVRRLHGEYLMTIDFNTICDKYGDRLYAAAFNICRQQQDAEDAVQDALIAYYKTEKEFQSEEHIKAWLLRVTINAAKSTKRLLWNKNRTSYEDYMDSLVFEEPSDKELLDEVLALPEKYRIVIHLFYYEEYKTKEIAEILKIPENTVKTRLLNGRKLLKTKLEGWEDE